jgi:hypothetical protein
MTTTEKLYSVLQTQLFRDTNALSRRTRMTSIINDSLDLTPILSLQSLPFISAPNQKRSQEQPTRTRTQSQLR